MNYALIALVVALVFVIIIIGIWLMSSTPDTIDVVPPPQLLQNGGAPVVDPLLQNGVSPVVDPPLRDLYGASEPIEVPVVPPYKFYHALDSKGNDIKQVTGLTNDISALLTLCKITPECVGFTHHGWLKRKIKPKDEMTKRGKAWKENSVAGQYVLT